MCKFIGRVIFCVVTELVALAIVDVIRGDKDESAENN